MLVLAVAVALLGAMILFIGHSLRTMTASATRSVPLDLQGPVAGYGQARSLAGEIAKQPDIAQASAVATAPFAGVSHRGAGGVTDAGAGAILAVPPDYLRRIDTFRFLRGGLRPGQVVLDQQLAATLRPQVGDTVGMRLGAHAPSRNFKVGGIALVTAPDVLFQPLNPQVGPAPAQPPANIAILPVATFAQHGRRRAALPRSPANPAAAAVPGTLSGVQWQVQAQLDRESLGGTPSEAFKRAGQIRNSVERSFPGKIQFVDNLSEALEAAAGDALYAEALFIMLAVPGALLALGLAYLAALGTVERDRRELALLRARGASRRQLLGMAATESSIVGLLAGLLGAGISFLAVALLIEGSVGLNLSRAATVVVVCVLLAIVGGMAARLGTGLRALSETVSAGRRGTRSGGVPLWRRLYLDFLALAISGLIYWLTASTGFSAVVNPDSNPTLSLSIYMFFAPALLWIGATLLLVRLRGRSSARSPGAYGEASGDQPAHLPARQRLRRGPAINRGLIFVGLLLAFGVSLGVFAATYNQQAGVDAQLTLGADITATAPPGVTAKNGLAKRIAGVPGVSATSAVDHSYAYVGPDLQDTFGIEPATIGAATTLRDSYFIGGGAQTMMSRLQSTPDGILVSKETITDYSLKVGDLLRLRVLDHRSGKFHIVPFHVVGSVQEFPSAPRDSFMVANLSYLQKADHAGGPNVVFASASEDPAAVAGRVAEATKGSASRVKDIRQQSVQTVSSITTIDLTGISRLEQAFAIVLAAAAMWLFVNLVVSERRHEFATMAALGASLRDIGAFVRSEAVAVLARGLALAAVLGWLLAEMLIAMLQHVFDPPPDQLAIPWGFLGLLAAAAVLGALLAALVAARSLRRLPLGSILREE